MIVKELIERLQKCDPELSVYIMRGADLLKDVELIENLLQITQSSIMCDNSVVLTITAGQ